MTPPMFGFVNDGEGSDEDYQTSHVVRVNWRVTDGESGVEHCEWVIGRTRGSSDIKQFQRVSAGQSTAQHDISSMLHTSSMTVCTTLRCFDKAGLVTAMTSDGVEVIQARNQTSVPGFSILRESQSVYSERDVCHQSQEKVRLRWDEAGSRVKLIVVGVEGENFARISAVPTHLDYSFVTLAVLSLQMSLSYQATGFPVDELDTVGETTTLIFTVHGKPPAAAGTGRLSVTRSGHRLTVSWLDLFTSPQAGLLYVVHTGTEPGSANVVDQLLTGRDEITLSFTSQHSTFHYLFITISAVDQCGLSGYLTKRINLN